MNNTKILILTSKGLCDYLKQEVAILNFPITSTNAYGVQINGTLADAMLLNLNLRCAHHVLYHLKDFFCLNPEKLYQEVYQIPWENIIDENGYVSVYSHVDNPTITDLRFANLKCKDAIVDRIFKIKGKRPNSGPDKNKTVIYLYWKNDQGSIYIDTSGESLAKRNYRKIPLTAPLQETLAAGIIAATGFKTEDNFVNPMCGSGTLAIEAAMIALNRKPGILRDNFGFMHIKAFNKQLWEDLRHKTQLTENKIIKGKIIATDIDEAAIAAARKNAEYARVDKFIEFSVCDYSKTPIPEGNGIIVFNPEYGLRLGETEKLENTYKEIGDFLKQKCKGYRGYVFTGNLSLGKKVGLKPKRRIPFYNAQIESRLYEYELY